MSMNRTLNKIIFLFLFSLPIVVLLSAIFARTSTNTVNESGIEYQTQDVTADQLKPSACNALSLNAVYTLTDGSSTNDLILGSSGSDALNGIDGDDCIVGGSGDDTLDGGDGTDICIGGDGTDSFSNCETQIDP